MSSSTRKNISDELEYREKECNAKVVYEYTRPDKNPYEYNDIKSFNQENPFDDEKDCSILIPNNSIKTDKYNRYYKDIYTNARCNKTNGFWVGSTINRNNSQDKGNCWIDKEDAECGDLLDNYKLIRKDEYENGNVSRDEIKNARRKCEVNPKCYFKRVSEFKRDCVARKRITIHSKSISKKSSNKSLSKNSSKSSSKSSSSNKFNLDFSNIEKSLNEFYSSQYKPETVDLIGKGNRCVENYEYSKSSSKKSSNKNSKVIEDNNVDIIDENIEAKIDYVNDLVKLEHMDENLPLDEFINKYHDEYYVEYIRYLLIDFDPNDEEDSEFIEMYMGKEDYINFEKFKEEYNKYVKIIKNIYSAPPSSKEHKHYYNYVSILYNKYFPKYFDNYENRDIKKYNISQALFIRHLILQSDLNDKNNEKFLKNYANNSKDYNEFKKLYKSGDTFDYQTYFPIYFKDSIDIYIEKIMKKYYLYCRYIISRTPPDNKNNIEDLLYYINDNDRNLLNKFVEEYNLLKTRSADPFSYFALYNKYFTRFYQFAITSDFIYYVKNKIKVLDPLITEQYEELKKYISKPELMKEFKKKYFLIEKEQNYDKLLDNLYKYYFPDYFGNIEKKYSSISSSFASSISTPSISSVSSVSSLSSSISKPPKLPTVPQSIINTICKTIHKKNLDKRGMLIWHSTGSGKTCTATAIMEGFWGTDMDIIYCSKIEALTSNPPTTFYECATNLFPRFAGKSIKEMEKEFKNIRFLSFAKLANRIENKTINLNNCILIIDEVHNLFRPLPNQKKQHEYLQKLLLDEKKFPKLKVFILTATLGDNPNEIIKLLNIVKNKDIKKIEYDDISNIDVFKEKIRGLISYFDMSNDRSKFPLVIDNEPKYINMSKKQFEIYIQKYNEVKKEHKDYDKLAASNSLNKYWMAARKYSNMLYKFEKGISSLRDFSPKLEELIANILKYPDEKQYAYSAFYENKGYGGQGILAVGLELKKKGYEQLTPSEAKRIFNNPTESDKKPRYILAITTQLGLDKGKELNEMTTLYNAPFNSNGEYVKIILASQSFNEGLDLKGVRHIHIFEPLITWASDRQTIGRAARNCSHSDLRLKDWTVNIHRYISDFPIDIKKDEGKIQELKDLIKEKETLLNESEVNLKEEQTKLKNAKAKLAKGKKQKIDIQDLDTEISTFAANVEYIKNEIKDIKNEIKDIKKELKKNDDGDDDGNKKGKKKGIKLDAKGIENIDRFIYKQAIDKMKEILTLYQVMQESAIDCLVLQKFHKNGNKELNCTEY